jgi:hypothetical protein
MKYLRKIFEDENKFKNTDEEILMFFTDYYDENPDNFSIKNVLVFDNERVVEETPYMKTPSKYRKGKLIKVKIAKPDGIIFSGSSSLTSISVLQDLLSDIERFYDLSGEDVNYKIDMNYMGLSVEFLVLGEYMKDSDSKVGKVDELLKEFKELFTKRGFRPKLKGNSVEIRTSAKKSWSAYGDYSVDLRSIMNKINNGDINLENLPRPNWRDLVEWYNKVQENRLSIKVMGGDHQFLLKLINQ